VEIIYLNEDYYGPNGFHAHDIAVLMLSNRVTFSNVVAPICIDWNNKYNVSNGVEGKVNFVFYGSMFFVNRRKFNNVEVNM